MKKIIIISFLGLTAAFPTAAQETQDSVFKAEVLEVLREETSALPDGSEARQQNLRLRGLEGVFEGETFDFEGIGSVDVIDKKIYEAGDKVLVAATYGPEGDVYFYVTDFVRTGRLSVLAALFLLFLLAVGRLKGLRSVLALTATFIIILKYVVPQIIGGASPLAVTLAGSFAILIAIIYITEGITLKSHISTASIFASLALTVFLSWFFVDYLKLTGAASEDVLFLFNLDGASINLKGLLLAGIIIGALGVLDDVVISQVSAAEEIASANRSLSRLEIFRKSYNIGVSHIASMANTLFLAYAGVSLPLLILFVSGGSAFSGWQQALSTELIATEIVRTLVGSIGLILAVPISTAIAAWVYGRGRA